MRNRPLHHGAPSRSKLFTGVCVAVAVALSAVILMATPAPADACKRHYVQRDPRPAFAKVGNRWEVRLNTYHRSYSFTGSNLRLKSVYVYTKDKRFADFLKKRTTQNGLYQAIVKAAAGHHCSDVMAGRTLVKVERAVAQAVAAHYTRQTRLRVRTPDLMIGLHTPYRIYCNPRK